MSKKRQEVQVDVLRGGRIIIRLASFPPVGETSANYEIFVLSVEKSNFLLAAIPRRKFAGKLGETL